jgi:hypothetical protein
MTVGMSKARIMEEMSQREPKVRLAGSAVKNKPTTNTAMKAGQRGSGLVCCTSSSIITIVSSLFLARVKDRTNYDVPAVEAAQQEGQLLLVIVNDKNYGFRH